MIDTKVDIPKKDLRNIVPEEKWNTLNANAQIVAKALTMYPHGTTFETLENLIDGHKKQHPNTQYNTSTGLLDLEQAQVLKRETHIDKIRKIIQEYESGNKGERQELQYRQAKLQVEEYEKNPAAHPEWEKPSFTLTTELLKFVETHETVFSK